jgi:hypothetical protein
MADGGWEEIAGGNARTGQALLAGLGAALDAAGGSSTMEYATVAVAAARTATGG